MSIDKIRSELFKLLSDEKESMYSSTSLEEKKEHNAKYNIYNEYYMLLRRNSSFSYVFDMKNKLLSTVLELEKKYKELLEKYENEKDSNKKNKMVGEINYYVVKIDAYNNIYNIINRHLKTNNNDYTSQSNKIIDVIGKMSSETNEERLSSLQSELFRMQEERRVTLTSQTDIFIIKEICQLESIEARIATSDSSYTSKTMSKREFLNALKDTIQAINEYYFLDYKKSKHYKDNPNMSKEENEMLRNQKLNIYINRYYSLISAAFKDNFYVLEKGDLKISTDDLINYLAIYNLDGNYEIFRSKYKNRLIGNKDVEKDDYLAKVEFLKKSINTLIEQCSLKIKTKNVEVTDSRETQDDLIKLRDRKISEIEGIIEGEKIHARR